MVLEIEESVEKQLAKIDDYTNQLLQLIPENLLNSTGEQLLAANFDLAFLLTGNKENGGCGHGRNEFDIERCSPLDSLMSSQYDSKPNQVSKYRWKTPNKQKFDSASKGKNNSSNKKTGHFFKASKTQQLGLSSGKKLNWKF